MSSDADLIDDLQTLNQISQTLNQAVDVQSALGDALAHLVELMGLQVGWVFLRDAAAVEKWWGPGYVLAAHHNLPPALALDSPEAWEGGCDCEGFCNKGKLNEAYNEVRCSRLQDASGDRRGLRIHASAPLRSGEQVLGILNVAAAEWEAFSPRALALLTNVGAQMGIALERARLFDLLQERRVLEQSALVELSSQLLRQPKLDDLMSYLVEEVKRLLNVDACALLLPDEVHGDLAFHAAAGWRVDPVSEGRHLPTVQRSASGWTIDLLQPMIVSDDPTDQDIPAWTSEWMRAEGFEMAAFVPLVVEDHAVGALVINTREARQLGEDETRFLQLMANQAAMAIEKERLHDEEVQHQRLEEELSVGRQIQRGLLPKSCPTVAGWEFCDIYQAARVVGGDFYDFFDLPGDVPRLGLVIADVSGKGVPAALFMGVSRTLIRSSALRGLSPGAALREANSRILEESESGYFLSVFYGILELESGRLVYANAGHNPPFWFRAATGTFQKLAADGIVLCVLDEIALEEKTVDINRGDVLIFYTDGVTEAMTEDYEEFGEARLQATVAASAGGTATQILSTIVDAVKIFTGPIDQSDDFTLFVVKRA